MFLPKNLADKGIRCTFANALGFTDEQMKNIHNYYSNKPTTTMARPIKETPILFGEDARRFEARMQEHRRISSEERAEMDAIYKTIMSTANF